MKKVRNWLVAGILLSVILMGMVLAACAVRAGGEPAPSKMKLDSGILTDATDYSSTLVLNEKNGNCVEFFAENRGQVGIKIAINEEVSVTLAPGEKGTVRMEVTNFLGIWDRSYQFKAVPTPNGGKISLYYSILQK